MLDMVTQIWCKAARNGSRTAVQLAASMSHWAPNDIDANDHRIRRRYQML